MSTTQQPTINETVVFVTEFASFDAAWNAATNTTAMFAAFQGMENKIKYIRQAQRWFVDMDKLELYYSYMTNDGVRILTKAEAHSMLSNSAFQYIQIMVGCVELNPERTGKLRFSNQYTNRQGAINLSKTSEAFAFNK